MFDLKYFCFVCVCVRIWIKDYKAIELIFGHGQQVKKKELLCFTCFSFILFFCLNSFNFMSKSNTTTTTTTKTSYFL